jgi:hypothetical protein
VEYDPSLGYPTKVFIDPERRVTDNDIVFTVTDFKKTAGNGPESNEH